jgi:hypothetical protein
MPGAPKPVCTVEVLNPDDILVLGINNKWFRTFTSSSDRYPIRLRVPAAFLNDGWNLITGDYSNVALVGKNDANVEYKVQLDGQDVVHVVYKTEVQPEHFEVHFKDTFSLKARAVDRGQGEDAGGRASKRFQSFMAWAPKEGAAPPPLPPQEGPPPG